MEYSPEEFADAVVAALKTRLAGALTAVADQYAATDAQEGRVVPLDPPRPEDYYPGGKGALGNRWPYIDVAATDLLLADYDLGQTEADGTLALVVVAYDSHPRFDILYRKVYRLGSAIHAVLADHGALPGGARIRSCRIAWRFNPDPDTQQREELVSGVMLAYELGTTSVGP